MPQHSKTVSSTVEAINAASHGSGTVAAMAAAKRSKFAEIYQNSLSAVINNSLAMKSAGAASGPTTAQVGSVQIIGGPAATSAVTDRLGVDVLTGVSLRE